MGLLKKLEPAEKVTVHPLVLRSLDALKCLLEKTMLNLLFPLEDQLVSLWMLVMNPFNIIPAVPTLNQNALVVDLIMPLLLLGIKKVVYLEEMMSGLSKTLGVLAGVLKDTKIGIANNES